MRGRRMVAVLLAVALGGLAGCDPLPSEAPQWTLEWREVRLPMPAGSTGRIAVRDAVRCGEAWYVVGGVFSAPGASRPAAWRSTDLRTWTSLEFAPRWFWAHRNVLFSVACRETPKGDEVAMVGAKSGGAHGNPRVSTWRARGDGVFVDELAGFELYGGPHSVSVGRITAGPPGWLISGNRMSGAAVWTSPDARGFRLHEARPKLASDATYDTLAVDAVWTGSEWTVVGSAQRTGRVPRVPMAWVSVDGRSWQRELVAYGDEYADLHRALPDGRAAGLRGDAFGMWRRTDSGWEQAGTFGAVDPESHASPFVSGLAATKEDLLATVSDGVRYELWIARDGGDSWEPMVTPTRPTTAGEHTMTIVATAGDVLLLADDGASGRVWVTDAAAL